MLPLSLFRERGFTTANAVSFFMYAGLFGALFLMAQFLQTALGHSTLQAGIRLLPWTAGPPSRRATPMLVAPLAGGLVGGVFGVAVLAAVFTHQGVYASPQAFVDRFQPALLVGAALTAVGIIAAVLAPGRPCPRADEATATKPALAFATKSE